MRALQIDTGLLLAGIIDAKEYFDSADPWTARHPRAGGFHLLPDELGLVPQLRSGHLMGWMPATSSARFGPVDWLQRGDDHLHSGAGFPDVSGARRSAWQNWTSGYLWQTHYGHAYIHFPPLFGHQYSHCWIDFRTINDAYMRARGITYFENSRRATLAQRAYCIAESGRVGRIQRYALGDHRMRHLPTLYPYRPRCAARRERRRHHRPDGPGEFLPFAPEVCIPSSAHVEHLPRSSG